MIETLPETNRKAVKVLLIEDHRVFREWLGHLITRDQTFTICGESDNVADALELIQQSSPDLLIVDLTLRNSSGIDLLKILKSMGQNIPALVLSMHDADLYAERALRAGARGFVSKHDASGTLIDAMHHIMDGGVYFQRAATAA